MGSINCSQYGQPLAYSIASNKPLDFSWGIEHYSIINFSDDLPKHEQIVLFKDVFAEINLHIWPLRIESTTNSVPEFIYFKIFFVGENSKVLDEDGNVITKCPYNFDANKGVLAVAYPRKGYDTDGHIYINDHYVWDYKREEGGYDLKKVLVHEILHALGLGHSTAMNDIMNEKYDRNNFITYDTITGLNKLYGNIRIDYMEKHLKNLHFAKRNPSLWSMIKGWWG